MEYQGKADVKVSVRVVKSGNVGSAQFYKWVADYSNVSFIGRLESNCKFTSMEAGWKHAALILGAFGLLPDKEGQLNQLMTLANS